MRSTLATLLEQNDLPAAYIASFHQWKQEHPRYRTIIHQLDERARMELRQTCSDALEQGTLLRWLATQTEDAHAYYGLLKTLDASALQHPSSFFVPIIVPPLHGTWWLLPPAPTLLPSSLPRERRHLEPDVRTELGLRCLIVHNHDGIQVQPARLPAATQIPRPLRIGLACPPMPLQYELTGRTNTRDEHLFRFVDTPPDDATRDLLRRVLEQAKDIHILIFPELEISPQVLRYLQEQLAQQPGPALIVAGSSHVQDDAGRWRNRCTLLDRAGRVLGSHDKTLPFGVPASDCHPPLPPEGIEEDMESGTTLTCFESTVGRLAIPICLDFCGNNLRARFADAGINLLLIPAMTTSMQRFEEVARELGTTSEASSFVANSRWIFRLTNGQGKIHLAYLPRRGALHSTTLDETAQLYVYTIPEPFQPTKLL